MNSVSLLLLLVTIGCNRSSKDEGNKVVAERLITQKRFSLNPDPEEYCDLKEDCELVIAKCGNLFTRYMEMTASVEEWNSGLMRFEVLNSPIPFDEVIEVTADGYYSNTISTETCKWDEPEAPVKKSSTDIQFTIIFMDGKLGFNSFPTSIVARMQWLFDVEIPIEE